MYVVSQARELRRGVRRGLTRAEFLDRKHAIRANQNDIGINKYVPGLSVCPKANNNNIGIFQ